MNHCHQSINKINGVNRFAGLLMNLVPAIGLCVLFCIAGFSKLSAQNNGLPEGFVAIFNGKNLSGWHVSRTNHHGTTGNFYVEDGAIIMKQNPFGRGGVLLSDKKYEDFELYLEVKTHPGTNGGIFFRSNESGSAYQIELNGDGELSTGNLLGEMLHVTTTAQAAGIREVWREGGWNEFRLRVTGEKPHMILWVNGQKMWDVQAKRNDLIADATEGMIGLQLHWSSTPTPVPGGSCCAYSWKPGAFHSFRNIGIKEL